MLFPTGLKGWVSLTESLSSQIFCGEILIDLLRNNLGLVPAVAPVHRAFAREVMRNVVVNVPPSYV